ncbi:MAG: AAA family ATPase [Pseudomonadota bacterium]
MYLKKIVLKNIKCFKELTLYFAKNETTRAWSVLLGENGLGKSTLLQAIGVVLAGPDAMRELLPVPEGWVRQGQTYGEIEAELIWTKGDAAPQKNFSVRYLVTGNEPVSLPEEYHSVPTIIPWAGHGDALSRENITNDMNLLKKTAYAEGKYGWFSCGYGPFRRLSGGGQNADSILYSRRKSARFVTLFREDAALTNAQNWIIELYNTARDGGIREARILKRVQSVLAENFFPQSCKLHLNAREALLQIGDKKPIRFQELSDGYRSMLALTIDLLHWLMTAFPDENDPLNCPGVVLIDELDAHTHPRWQRQMGDWLRQKFPKIQFIVATHSPFLAQVADAPEDNIVLEDQGVLGVCPRTDVEAASTWRVDQILTELFDLPTTYNPEIEARLTRHQQLHQARQAQQLLPEQEEEYQRLTLWRMNHIPPAIEEPASRRVAQTLIKAIDKHHAELEDMV